MRVGEAKGKSTGPTGGALVFGCIVPWGRLLLCMYDKLEGIRWDVNFGVLALMRKPIPLTYYEFKVRVTIN